MKLAFATTIHPWSEDWQTYLIDHSREHVVVAVIADPSTLWDWDWSVLVIDSTSPMFSAGLVAATAAKGRSVLAVWDPVDPAGKERALSAGVAPNTLIESNADADEFLKVLDANSGEWARAQPLAGSRRPRVAKVATSRGLLVAVGGPTPGSAGVGIALAAAFTSRDQWPVLVDANEVYPEVAAALDLAPVPNVTSAMDGEVTNACLPYPDSGFWVLGGVADPVLWEETARAAREMIGAVAQSFAVTVAVVGPIVDEVAGAGKERFVLSWAAMSAADVIVGVGDGSPTGVVNLARWLESARAVARPDVPAHLVATCPPRGRRSEVSDHLAEMGAASAVVVPAPTPTRRAWNGGPPRKAVMRAGSTLAKRIGKTA